MNVKNSNGRLKALKSIECERGRGHIIRERSLSSDRIYGSALLGLKKVGQNTG